MTTALTWRTISRYKVIQIFMNEEMPKLKTEQMQIKREIYY